MSGPFTFTTLSLSQRSTRQVFNFNFNIFLSNRSSVWTKLVNIFSQEQIKTLCILSFPKKDLSLLWLWGKGGGIKCVPREVESWWLSLECGWAGLMHHLPRISHANTGIHWRTHKYSRTTFCAEDNWPILTESIWRNPKLFWFWNR